MGGRTNSVFRFTVTLSPPAPRVPIVCQHNETVRCCKILRQLLSSGKTNESAQEGVDKN